MAALGATLGEGEGFCCVAGSLATTAVEFPAEFAEAFWGPAKVLMPQRLRKIRTSVVPLVAFLIRD